MAETNSMIASAVVVPAALEETLASTGAVKRRQSSTSESGSKRPRLAVQGEESNKQPIAVNEPPAIRPSGVPPSNGSQLKGNGGQEEERKRGKRLFGALLGTLSQSSSSTAQKRRAEIERKQQAKLRVQAEEDDEKKRTQLEELLATRRLEQRKFDEQSMHIRHSNSLAMAQFFRTKAEPRLYYKPWDLRTQEKELIQAQIKNAEAQIEKELQVSRGEVHDEGTSPPPTNAQLDGSADALDPPQSLVGSHETIAAESTTLTDADTNTIAEPPDETPDAEQGKELGDDNEDLVVEAGEDAVIY